MQSIKANTKRELNVSKCQITIHIYAVAIIICYKLNPNATNIRLSLFIHLLLSTYFILQKV